MSYGDSPVDDMTSHDTSIKVNFRTNRTTGHEANLVAQYRNMRLLTVEVLSSVKLNSSGGANALAAISFALGIVVKTLMTFLDVAQ